MSQEFSIKELKRQMDHNDMKQKDLCDILNLTQQKVSQMMNGQRKISHAEQKLLKLYFYGEFPFQPSSQTLSSILDFSDDEWDLIQKLANKQGFTSAKAWIVSQIRAYLDHNPLAKDIKNPQKKRQMGR